MVHPALTRRRSRALLVAPLCLVVAMGCGKSTDAAGGAALAKEACGVFKGLTAPAATGQQSQIAFAKESYTRFVQAAELAGRAEAKDPRWRTLQTSAQDEAAAFEVVVKASDPKTSAGVSSAAVANAVKAANAARPVLLAQCEKADPGFLTHSSTTTSPTSTNGP